MDSLFIILTILGLSLFEIIISIDNAIINAEVLSTMQQKARKWFTTWGIFIAVFIIRGIFPWLIVFATNPALGPIGALTATFSNDPKIAHTIESSAPILFIGGGTFLIFLFFHWLFLEPKSYGLFHEPFFHRQGAWFYSTVSILLLLIVWFALQKDPILAFSAAAGSTAFFITHGFKQYAQAQEEELVEKKGLSDLSKILYLEVIDTTFSVDGVIGAFAFTLSVPIIFLGNGIGAVMLRNLTVKNIERIKKYRYLKNGAMYSILFLGLVMLLESFGFEIPPWVSPAVTFATVAYFFQKSRGLSVVK